MEKTTIDDLRKYLNKCIDQDGIIDGKRRFALQLGMVENELFNDVDEVKPTIYNFPAYPEDAYLEELPIVDEGSIQTTSNVVSL